MKAKLKKLHGKMKALEAKIAAVQEIEDAKKAVMALEVFERILALDIIVLSEEFHRIAAQHLPK